MYIYKCVVDIEEHLALFACTPSNNVNSFSASLHSHCNAFSFKFLFFMDFSILRVFFHSLLLLCFCRQKFRVLRKHFGIISDATIRFNPLLWIWFTVCHFVGFVYPTKRKMFITLMQMVLNHLPKQWKILQGITASEYTFLQCLSIRKIIRIITRFDIFSRVFSFFFPSSVCVLLNLCGKELASLQSLFWKRTLRFSN